MMFACGEANVMIVTYKSCPISSSAAFSVDSEANILKIM